MTRDLFVHIVSSLAEKLVGTEFEGHVFAVGGSVRDYVMQNEIKDIDLVVDLPEGGINLAKHLSMTENLLYAPVIYPTYGTCQFRLKEFPEYELEAVHTRGEQYHDKNSRNPMTYFSDINDDSIRRDLTINALYYDIFNDKIVDPTEKGLNDIKNHIIRTSNEDPCIVFDDDPLRILRVVRFAAKYGWEIDKKTYGAMHKYFDRLKIISRERITTELVNMLSTKHPDKAMHLLNDLGLWSFVVLGLDLSPNVYNLGKEDEKQLANALKVCVERNLPLETKLAIIYHMFDCITTAEIMHNIKFSNDMIKEVKLILKNLYEIQNDLDDCRIREIQLDYKDKQSFMKLVNCVQALFGDEKAKTVVEKTESGETVMFGYKLPVNGDDVMREYGISPGENVKYVLDHLLDYACQKPNATYNELIAKGLHFKKIFC